MSEIKSTIERLTFAAVRAIWKRAEQLYEKHWEYPRATIRRQKRLIDALGKTLDGVIAERDALQDELDFLRSLLPSEEAA